LVGKIQERYGLTKAKAEEQASRGPGQQGDVLQNALNQVVEGFQSWSPSAHGGLHDKEEKKRCRQCL